MREPVRHARGGGAGAACPAHSAPGFSPQTQQPGRGNRAKLARTRHGQTVSRGESGEFSRELSVVGGAGDSLCPLVRLVMRVPRPAGRPDRRGAGVGKQHRLPAGRKPSRARRGGGGWQ